MPVKPGEWQALREHVVRCLRNFHRLPLLADIKRTPVERWILLEDIGSFPWEGTRIVDGARLRLLEPGRPPAARRLEDGGRRRGRLPPARRLRAVFPRGPRCGPVAGGPARGEPTRGQGHRASLGRAEPRPRPGLHPAVGALDEGVSRGCREERRPRGRLREDGARPHLPLVQLPRGVPPGAAAISRARRRAGRKPGRRRPPTREGFARRSGRHAARLLGGRGRFLVPGLRHRGHARRSRSRRPEPGHRALPALVLG